MMKLLETRPGETGRLIRSVRFKTDFKTGQVQIEELYNPGDTIEDGYGNFEETYTSIIHVWHWRQVFNGSFKDAQEARDEWVRRMRAHPGADDYAKHNKLPG